MWLRRVAGSRHLCLVFAFEQLRHGAFGICHTVVALFVFFGIWRRVAPLARSHLLLFVGSRSRLLINKSRLRVDLLLLVGAFCSGSSSVQVLI